MTARSASNDTPRPTGATAGAGPTSWPSRSLTAPAARATVRRADNRAGPAQRHGRHGVPIVSSPPYHNTRTHGRPDLVPDGAPSTTTVLTGPSPFRISTMETTNSIQQASEQIRTIVTSGPAASDTVGHVTTRNPQPEAIAAARQMLEPRVQSIADLAHAHDLVNQRRAEATAAETALAHAVTEYAERYATARRAHGWTPAELGELGFPDNQPHANRTRTHRRHATPTNPTRPAPPPAAPGPPGATPGGDRNPQPTDAEP